MLLYFSRAFRIHFTCCFARCQARNPPFSSPHLWLCNTSVIGFFAGCISEGKILKQEWQGILSQSTRKYTRMTLILSPSFQRRFANLLLLPQTLNEMDGRCCTAYFEMTACLLSEAFLDEKAVAESNYIHESLSLGTTNSLEIKGKQAETSWAWCVLGPQEKERRYKDLGIRDKITLSSGRFLLGNKYVDRMFYLPIEVVKFLKFAGECLSLYITHLKRTSFFHHLIPSGSFNHCLWVHDRHLLEDISVSNKIVFSCPLKKVSRTLVKRRENY